MNQSENPKITATSWSELASLSLPDRLKTIGDQTVGRLVFSTSFGLEDQAITHAIALSGVDIGVATLDTGRLFPESMDLWAETEARYRLRIAAFAPDRETVETLLERDGPYGFRQSVEARKACCGVRKIEPLRRLLAGASGWITGLRMAQSSFRADVGFSSYDHDFRVIKYNPIADWSRSDLERYVSAYDIPYNRLHDQGFPSIGCAPCTRAVRVGEAERAGRWWWEVEDKRECGLHARPGFASGQSQSAGVTELTESLA